MKPNYNRSTILAGNKIKRKLEENPEAISFRNMASDPMNSGQNLDQDSRMAGDMLGARAQEMLNNPVAQQQTMEWWEAFKMSRPGRDWEMARLEAQKATMDEVV
tara:strand:- start:1262 stop:1573 length:312 start_codon:yes stop_codon:yes gene_type:complete